MTPEPVRLLAEQVILDLDWTRIRGRLELRGDHDLTLLTPFSRTQDPLRLSYDTSSVPWIDLPTGHVLICSHGPYAHLPAALEELELAARIGEHDVGQQRGLLVQMRIC